MEQQRFWGGLPSFGKSVWRGIGNPIREKMEQRHGDQVLILKVKE